MSNDIVDTNGKIYPHFVDSGMSYDEWHLSVPLKYKMPCDGCEHLLKTENGDRKAYACIFRPNFPPLGDRDNYYLNFNKPTFSHKEIFGPTDKDHHAYLCDFKTNK